MKTRQVLIGLGIAAALAAGIGAYSASAQPGGWGPGMMGGWGGQGGPGPGNCPGFDQGAGAGPGGGYGPGYRMRGWGGGYGPGMMRGYGPGMMGGYGPGYDRSADAQGNVNLSPDDVKTRMERWLSWRGNDRLKVGDVKEKDADSITVDVVTKDNSLVERFIFDRHTGFVRRDRS